MIAMQPPKLVSPTPSCSIAGESSVWETSRETGAGEAADLNLVRNGWPPSDYTGDHGARVDARKRGVDGSSWCELPGNQRSSDTLEGEAYGSSAPRGKVGHAWQ
jgi:hypothetical protein